MTTQTINGAAVEIVVIAADGKTDPAATLDAREAAAVQAVDQALAVVDCNRNGSGLQSSQFQDRINCNHRRRQDHIICH